MSAMHRLPRILVLSVVLLGLSGCRHGATTEIPPRTWESSETVRTPEERRIFHLPVRLITHPEYNYTSLVFTEPGSDKTHDLYLSDREAIRLGGVPSTQPVHIHVLVHQEINKGEGRWRESRWERETLDALAVDGVALVDRSVCESHQLKMTRQSVPIHYGLPSREFLEATHTFPNAAFTLGGCCIDPSSPKTDYAYVCPACEKACHDWGEAAAANR